MSINKCFTVINYSDDREKVWTQLIVLLYFFEVRTKLFHNATRFTTSTYLFNLSILSIIYTNF